MFKMTQPTHHDWEEEIISEYHDPSIKKSLQELLDQARIEEKKRVIEMLNTMSTITSVPDNAWNAGYHKAIEVALHNIKNSK